MKNYFVTSSNVSAVADTLLNLEQHHLQEKYQLDAPAFILPLQKALNNYLHPPENEQDKKRWITIDVIEDDLLNLLAHVNACIALLTPEAQTQLAQQFSQHSLYKEHEPISQ